MSVKSLIFKAVLILVGAGGGYLYYFFWGCQSGSCPISSNPYTSIGYGALIGLALALIVSAKKRKNV